MELGTLVTNIIITIWGISMAALMPLINKAEIPGKVYTFKTRFDERIPLILPFIIPYLLYFPYLVLPWAYLFFFEPDIYLEFVVSLGLINMIANFVFIALQTSAPRVEIISEDVNAKLLRWHYGMAKPLNALPSLHVAHSLCVSIFMILAVPELTLIWVLIAFLISISTLLVKEHYIPDVITGGILGFAIPFLVIGGV
jgi:membrane-associated phospholipid phosphatase